MAMETPPAPPRMAARLAVVDLLVRAGELALCGVPVLSWLARLPGGERATRILLPVAAALWLALALRLADSVRPIAALLAARAAQQACPDEAAQRALGRAPRESAMLHFLFWVALAATVTLTALVRGVGSPTEAAALATLAIVHAAGLGATRRLALERALEPLRSVVTPHLEGIRVLAGGYRAALMLTALAVLGLGHAVLALDALAFAGLGATHLAATSLALWPTLGLAGLLLARSLRRRAAPIESYFEAMLRTPGTRGPSRDEPRAVGAFRAAQALPYRMAAYQGLSLLLASIGAVVVGRRLFGVDVASAGRLLGAAALAVAASMLGEALLLRAALRPLMRHLGSRHVLPIGDVRAALGLGPKLVASFVGVAGLAAGVIGLGAGRPLGLPAVAALIVGLALAAGLALFVVREVVAPLRVLESRSEEMARGELARPVPPSGEADELGRLTAAFEEMRRSLRDRLRSTESINIDLEREVRRRTDALEQRNAELREALEKLRRAQDNLIRSEKLASMGRLVAGIAHEINNPVNAVINSLGPLEESVRRIGAAKDVSQAAELASAAEEMLAVIQRGAARTKAIVQALHNYSRGDESVQREVNLVRSIDDSLDLLRHRLRHVQVVKELDPAARLVIMGFPGQIDQVLMNLVTNAAQAIGERSGTIRVTGGVSDNGDVLVSVSDDGPGIAPEVLPRIFDPFFTTKDVGEGSGLGLSIVHGIIERHGGHIEVDSAPGRGTTFRIRFPRGKTPVRAASPGP